MNNSWTKFVSRLVILCMLALPFQAAQATLIGTAQVASATQAQSDADKVRTFLARSDVRQQLQAMGIDAKNAQDRTAAMTDEEIHAIAGKIDTLPAGATSGWAVAGIVIVVALIVYWIWK